MRKRGTKNKWSQTKFFFAEQLYSLLSYWRNLLESVSNQHKAPRANTAEQHTALQNTAGFLSLYLLRCVEVIIGACWRKISYWFLCKRCYDINFQLSPPLNDVLSDDHATWWLHHIIAAATVIFLCSIAVHRLLQRSTSKNRAAIPNLWPSTYLQPVRSALHIDPINLWDNTIDTPKTTRCHQLLYEYYRQ